MLLAGAVAGMLAGSESALLAMFAVALLFQLAEGQGGKLPGYLFGYGLLWGITRAALLWMAATSSGTALSLSNMGLAGRRGMVPILFALLLAKAPVGSFMASLNAMRLPKAFGIGAAILLRFFPTLAQEYRSIRNAQKFRGIGVGCWDTLLHLPRVLSCLLIPLIIRITRISEELSASVTVRGVRFGGEVVSYRPIRFSARDAAFLAAGAGALLLILSLDCGLWGGVST